MNYEKEANFHQNLLKKLLQTTEVDRFDDPLGVKATDSMSKLAQFWR